MPRIVTRPVIDIIASVIRRSWRRVVGSRHGLKHAKTVIISGMGARVELGWGIHILHGAAALLLSISTRCSAILSHRHFWRRYCKQRKKSYGDQDIMIDGHN